MQFLRGVTSGGKDGSILPHLLLPSGELFEIKSGDWLWIHDKNNTTLFSGVHIRQRQVALIQPPNAKYVKFCFCTQLGIDAERWTSLFVEFDGDDNALPTSLPCTLVRIPAMLSLYGGVEAALNFRLPPFSFSVRVIEGTLEAFFETGSEGVWWSIYENGKQGYEGLNSLESGDLISIKDHNGKQLFRGMILRDNYVGWSEYPLNPGYGQPAALGLWIHWTQAGWQPDDWAKLFYQTVEYQGKELANGETHYPVVLLRIGSVLFFAKLLERRLNASSKKKLFPNSEGESFE